MKLIHTFKLATALFGVLATSSQLCALTQDEIVNQTKASVVAIIERNSATGEAWEGTGWFVTHNRVVTNSHIVSQGKDHNWNEMDIVNLGTGEHYSVDHVAYNNSSTDLAVIVVNESSAVHLNLSVSPLRTGMATVVIGNPNEQYGKVSSGQIGEIYEHGPDKLDNYFTVRGAHIDYGSSGSPVLDSNGDVIGMIWGVVSEAAPPSARGTCCRSILIRPSLTRSRSSRTRYSCSPLHSVSLNPLRPCSRHSMPVVSTPYCSTVLENRQELK